MDFDSTSSTEERYELEAAVQAVDVAPTYGVSWLVGDLPPAVSFGRADLETAYGPRAAGLDDGGDGGDAALVVVGVVVGLLLAGAVVLLVVLVRRSRRPPRAWTAPPGWGVPQGTWGPPQGAWGTWPAPGSSPAAGPARTLAAGALDPDDVWQPPAGQR